MSIRRGKVTTRSINPREPSSRENGIDAEERVVRR